MDQNKLEQYYREGRGEWWFYPLWLKILYCIALPFKLFWCYLWWCVMKFARGLYMLGDLMCGLHWNEGNWMEEV